MLLRRGGPRHTTYDLGLLKVDPDAELVRRLPDCCSHTSLLRLLPFSGNTPAGCLAWCPTATNTGFKLVRCLPQRGSQL